ncbi:hypothetical protein HMPREF9144_0440 [Prevotella pallens ATCC 700821]|uniref:Uncharacterized protein n=1 Tax=Prevotella pallens ATCC 700821 TaxID=997353 RepID=F9DFK0_9BACT|nr:hypothetical protein HMPREF9144_0440 [Prevotella pallens ATCC 700821]
MRSKAFTNISVFVKECIVSLKLLIISIKHLQKYEFFCILSKK